MWTSTDSKNVILPKSSFSCTLRLALSNQSKFPFVHAIKPSKLIAMKINTLGFKTSLNSDLFYQ